MITDKMTTEELATELQNLGYFTSIENGVLKVATEAIKPTILMKSRKELLPDSKIDRLVNFEPFVKELEKTLKLTAGSTVKVSLWSRIHPIGHVDMFSEYGNYSIHVTVPDGKEHEMCKELADDLRNMGYQVPSSCYPDTFTDIYVSM